MNWSDEEEEKEENENEKIEKKEKEEDKANEDDNKKVSKEDEDEDSESDSRKIRSPKEKIIEFIKSKYHSIKNGIKNATYKIVLDNSNELFKNNEKINSIFKKEEIPAYYYESFALVEDLANMPKEELKKLSSQKESKENYNAISSLKKAQVKTLKKIGAALEEYKKNRKSEEEELEKDLEAILKKEKKEEEDSDDDEDIIKLIKRDDDENKDPQERRKKWVKKEKVEEGGKKQKITKTKRPANIGNKPYLDESDSKNETIEEVISQADIEKEYDQISKQRGQNKARHDVVQRLEFLYSKTSNQLLQIKLLTLSNLLCFDNYTNQLSAFSLSLWDKVYKDIEALLQLHDSLIKGSNEQNKDIENMSLILQNNLSTMMEKLENELYKSLQFNVSNHQDYINSLINEIKFLKLCKKAEIFYSNLKNQISIAKIYLLVIMHTYYKSELSVKALIKKNNIKLEKDDYVQKIILDNDKDYFKMLCNHAYQILDEENKVKVMLYHIYFLCIKNEYESASKLFNSSNLYELVSVFKSETLKILFNRTLAQLSLCAFKNLDLEEVLRYLTPLCTKGPTKLKDYLSQSYTKESEKNNTLFDREDKKRAIPYIMRINTEDLDTIFYLSSMIYDAPKILLEKIFGNDATNENNYSSHAFERIFYNFQRQQFNGPSNVDKDKILSMTTVLMKGNWKKCTEEIKKLSLIKKYSNLQENLFQLIKRTALKCYIIFYMNEYLSFELNKLSNRFEIDENEVKNIINDMILKRQIKAKWNENYLLMKTNDRDSIVNMKKLVDNVQTITKQNLELMQTVMALANTE